MGKLLNGLGKGGYMAIIIEEKKTEMDIIFEKVTTLEREAYHCLEVGDYILRLSQEILKNIEAIKKQKQEAA